MKGPDLFAGVDPGWSGSIMIINREGTWTLEIPMTWTIQDIGVNLRSHCKEISFALIERVGGGLYQGKKGKMGVQSAFKFGDAFGIMRGMITICRIRHEYISPTDWQKEMKCRTKGDKKISKAAAQRLFPDVEIVHRNADALLLAELARRIAIERGW